MASYLDIAGFAALTTMPSVFVSAIEDVSPGWIAGQLEYWSHQIDSRLTKRYATPFRAPYPVAVTGWLARIVTVRCYLKRGIDPNDIQFDEIKLDAERAMEEIKEAASSHEGLFELPLRADTHENGVVRSDTFGYAEASPYVWTSIQRGRGRVEDASGGGTIS